MKVSVLLLSFNEAANLPRCLDSLTWCDDVVLVDSGSTDGTVEIAKAHNVRVLRRPFDDFASQRNFGLTNAAFKHDWILHLDADEALTPAFTERLSALEPGDGIDAYYIPSKLMLFDRWLRRSSMFPVYQVRLGRIGRLRFRQVGHGQREDVPPERISTFDEPYLHYAFANGLKRWLENHVRYAAAESVELVSGRKDQAFRMQDLLSRDRVVRRRAAKDFAGRLPLVFRPPMRFFYVYILRCGFLDGSAGFLYASMLTVYEAMIAILAYEKFRQR